MGVDSFFHPKIGGGGSFCLLSIYQAGFHSPLLPESSTTQQGQKGIESGQKGAKVNIYLLDFVSPRGSRRREVSKSKHIFEIWCECVWSCAPLVVVSTGGICAGFRTCRTCHRSALVLWWSAPRLLSALLLCACRVACKYGSISRFKGVFRGFWGSCVGLCGFGAFRGLCGFCARVELGGYMTCGVFAPIFPFFHLLRISSEALPLLSLACPLGCLASDHGLVLSLFVGCCCFFFPYGCMRKKKGRKVFLRPLLSCCVLLYLVAALYSSYSFGVSPFIS